MYVLYDPKDGNIQQSVQGTQDVAKYTALALGLRYLNVPQSFDDLHADDYSSKCKVENEQLVRIDG